MPYYNAGDYYRAGGYYRAGDYYRAGGLGSFLGGLAKGVVGGIGGFLTGGPVGAVKGAASGLGLIRSGQTLPQIAPPVSSMGLVPFGGVQEPGVTGIVHRLIPGGKTGLGRLKKDGTYTDRRRPRLNPLNPRALKRALRREAGFLKFARRVGHFAGIKGTYKLKRGKRK